MTAIFQFLNTVICSPIGLTRKKGMNKTKENVNYIKEKSRVLRNNKTGLLTLSSLSSNRINSVPQYTQVYIFSGKPTLR